MSKPPKQPISNYLFHRLVLSDLGINVNYDLPVRIPCPLPCVNTHDMFVAPDSLFGAWFTCKHCGFSGDALELYKLLSGCETMEDAIIRQSDAIPGDSNRAKALGYYATMNALRGLLAPANVIRPTSRAIDKLVSAGIYGGNMAWLQPFVAVRTQPELKVMGLKGEFIRGNTNIVVPCCDQPGRVRSVVIIKADGGHAISRVSAPYLTNDDAGIAFLHNVRQLPPVHRLYVMEDVVAATILHRMYYMATGGTLPLVAYTAGSDMRHLQHIEAASVVVIPEHINMASLETAAFIRDLGFDVHVGDRASMGGGTSRANLEVNHLTAAGASADRLDKVITEFTRTTGVIPHFVTPAARRKLAAVVGDDTEAPLSAGQVKCGNYLVEDRPDGLYVINGKQYKGECISNAKIIPDSLITVDGRRSPICNGTLTVGSNAISFSDHLSVINRTPAAWVRSQMHYFPSDTPELHVNRWAYTNLCQLGMMLHAPETYSVPAPFVLKFKDPKMMFPNFIVTDKEIAPRKVAGAFQGYPCCALEYGWEIPWDAMPSLLADGASTEVFWAVMICMIYNIVSPYYGLRPMSFALANLPEESTVLDWYANMLELPSARHPARFTARTTTARKLDYRLPLYLQLQANQHLVTAAATGRQSPCIISASKFDADMLATCPGWWQIDATGANRLLCSSDMVYMIPEIVHALFKQPYTNHDDLVMHIAETMHAWIRENNTSLNPNVIYSASHRIDQSQNKTSSLLSTTIKHLMMQMASGRIAPNVVKSAMYVEHDKLVVRTDKLRKLLHMLWPGAGTVKALNLSVWLGDLDGYTIAGANTVTIDKTAAAAFTVQQDDSKDSGKLHSRANEPA